MAERMGAVCVMVRDNDGAILMQHRDNNPGILYPDHWSLLSGAVESSETPEQAMARELLEEAGYIARAMTLLFTSPQTVGGTTIERHIFLVDYDSSQTIICNEGREIRFVTPVEILRLKVFGDHIGFIQRARSKLNHNRLSI